MAGCEELQAVKEAELAAALKVSVRTLQNWRSQRKGPKYTKCGWSVRYRLRDVEAWLREQGR